MIRREVREDGSVWLQGSRSRYLVCRPKPGVMLVVAGGFDVDGVGLAVLDEVKAEVRRSGPVALFIDARASAGSATPVSDAWTAFLREHRRELRRMAVLVASRALYLIVSITKVLSRTGEFVVVHREAESFERALAEEAPGYTAPPLPDAEEETDETAA